MDFDIEIKENDALIIFDNSYKAYLITVSDPTEFSRKILNAVIAHYKENGETDKMNQLKYLGFNYLKYPRMKRL